MCRFLSAIAFSDGTVFCSPDITDSHEDLVAALGLDDYASECRLWCRVEYCASDGHQAWDFDSYVLSVDEPTSVPWWNDEIKGRIASELRRRLDAMIPKHPERLLIGGCWVVREQTVKVLSGRVQAFGSSQVTALGSSQVTAWDSSHVEARGSSQVTAWNSSQVTAWGSSHVEALGSSHVTALDSSHVTAWDSSQVTAWNSSHVDAWDSSQVTDLRPPTGPAVTP
jgi:hypothetical protein